MSEAEELEFKKARQKYLGGSDMGALLGIAPPSWEVNSPVTLYLAKTQPPKIAPTSARFKKRGKRWEGVVAEMLEERFREEGHVVVVTGRNQNYTDTNFPYFRCEIDFELEIDGSNEKVNCELKTVHPFKMKEWGEEYTDEAPDYYIAQAQWGLGITGRNICYIAALFGADDLYVYPVQRSEELIGALRIAAQNFWTNHIVPKKKPDPTSMNDLDALYETDNGKSFDFSQSMAFRDAYSEYVAANAQVAMFQEKKDKQEEVLKSLMQETQTAVLFGKSVLSWKSQKTKRLNQTRLKEEAPAVYRAFCDESETRVFRLSRSKK